jgi:hypothetical protein
MLRYFRARTSGRHVLLALAILALCMKIAFPPGFMAGSSLAQPIVICSGQGPAMVMMDRDGHRMPAEAPHKGGDHSCTFAGHGAAPLTPDLRSASVAEPSPLEADLPAAFPAVTPGRGMAAPPPPSHAPPTFRA